jgi:hypothetical protein
MSKKRQGSLLEELETREVWPARPPLNPRAHLKTALFRTMKDSRWSRPQIVDRMNTAFKLAELPNRVSLARLDAWAAMSKPALPDLLEAEFLCWAAESRRPLAGQAERLGALLVDGQEKKFLELGKAEHELRQLGKTARRLRQEIEDKGTG